MTADIANPMQEKLDGQLFWEIDNLMAKFQAQALLDGWFVNFTLFSECTKY